VDYEKRMGTYIVHGFAFSLNFGVLATVLWNWYNAMY